MSEKINFSHLPLPSGYGRYHEPTASNYAIAAEEQYASESIEFDSITEDDISRTDDGAWVRAWVWVADDTL